MAYWQNPIRSPLLCSTGVLDRFGFSTGDPEPAPPTVVRVVPDGRCELIFSTPVSRDGTPRGPARGQLFGVHSRPLLVHSGGPAINTSARLYAGAAREIFGLDLAAATEQPIALEDLWGDEATELGERLATAPDHRDIDVPTVHDEHLLVAIVHALGQVGPTRVKCRHPPIEAQRHRGSA